MSAPEAHPGCFSLTVDGRDVAALPHETLLCAARRAGIEIPALCHHPDLEPEGACRLCLVEVVRPDRGGAREVVTSCSYPASPGLVVRSDSALVREARQEAVARLLDRCPGSQVIQALARQHGVPSAPADRGSEADLCILCGLCVRVCGVYATSAIRAGEPGSRRVVGGPNGAVPEGCVGCGACAQVCPTGQIRGQRIAGGYRIWGAGFPAAVCGVWGERCVGCCACEEACPFDVPRVVLLSHGRRRAMIAAARCRGCGVCVGACPVGAVLQAAPGDADLLGPRPSLQGGAP